MSVPATKTSSEDLLQPKQASSAIQQLESRGDFRFRGIQALFTVIEKWTEKFDTNGVLASIEQLKNDNQLPDDKIKEYLIELLGRGSSSGASIAALSSLQFISGSNARLESMVVFCRPTAADKNSIEKYYKSQLTRNIKAISNWLDNRKILPEDKMRDHLHAAIKSDKLQLTRARAQIARFFINEFDITPEHKKNTNLNYTKPALKGLLDNRKIIMLKGAALDGQPFSFLFFNNDSELEKRSNILINYFKNHISQDTQAEEQSIAEYLSGATEALKDRYTSLSPGEQQVIQELQVLADKIEKVKKDQEASKKSEKVENIAEMLLQADHVVEASFFKDADTDTIKALHNVSGILNAEYAIRSKINEYYLHRNRISDAISYARDLFDKTDDSSHVQILSAMGLEKYLDKDHYKAFLDLEERVLFNKLPFFTRIWRSLFGNRKLKQKEVVQIKNAFNKEQVEKKISIRKTEAAAERKKLVSKRMGKGSADDTGESSEQDPKNKKEKGSFGKPDELTDEEKLENVKKMEDIKELMSKILHELDAAWDSGDFPNREFLLKKLKKDFSKENELIMFLKKNAKKEIYSFKVSVEKPEFMWPILITRRYLKKQGKSLYNKYQEIADKQRKSDMPNQEAFDVANSVEIFLGKILPKL